jgi:ligand-binding sensor domain-containing protein
VTDPTGNGNDRTRGAIAEYRATIAVYPESAVLEPEAAFARWTTFVAHRAVRAIAVAPVSRIVWIATWGGVLGWDRTDEYVYRRYSSEHGLAGTPSCIAVGDDDRPWVGHAEGGLSWFDAGRWSPYSHLRDVRVVAIAPARAGGMWVATPDAIVLVERGAAPVEVVRGDASCVGATALLGDGDGVLVGSPSGLFRVSERSPVVRMSADAIAECTALARTRQGAVVAGTPDGVVLNGERVAPGGGDAAVVGLAPSRVGIWVLTRSGIARIENGTWRPAPLAPPDLPAARAIAVAGPNDDYLWVGTDDLVSGLRLNDEAPWDVGVLPAHDEDRLGNLGRCAVVDDTGRVWIGTSGGVFIGEPNGTWSFDPEPGDVRSIMLASTAYRESSIWILGWPSGVSRVPMPGRLSENAAVPAGLPRMVARGYDWQPYAWIGDAVWRLGARPELEALHVPVDARSVVQAPGNAWYAATDRGLLRHDRVSDEWALDPALGVASVTALAAIAFSLFAGASGAFWMLDARGWRKLELQHAGVRWTEPVTALARSGDIDTIWIACGGRVARCATEDGTVLEVFDRFDSGVCGSVVTAIVETDGVLWVVSRSGIARHVLLR